MRIVFCGTPSFAVPTLKHLLAQTDFEIVGVITQPDRPRGRGQEVSFSPVKEAALAANVAVHQPEKIRAPDSEALLQKLAPDCDSGLDQFARFPAPQISRRCTHQLGHREWRDAHRGDDDANRRWDGYR